MLFKLVPGGLLHISDKIGKKYQGLETCRRVRNLDCCRTSITSSSSGWNTVTYSQVRKSPMTGNGTPDGISASTGIFVCAIKGAYKFDFQGEKVYTK